MLETSLLCRQTLNLIWYYLVIFVCNVIYAPYIYRSSWSCLLELPHSRRLWRWVLKFTTTSRHFSHISHVPIWFLSFQTVSYIKFIYLYLFSAVCYQEEVWAGCHQCWWWGWFCSKHSGFLLVLVCGILIFSSRCLEATKLQDTFFCRFTKTRINVLRHIL